MLRKFTMVFVAVAWILGVPAIGSAEEMVVVCSPETCNCTSGTISEEWCHTHSKSVGGKISASLGKKGVGEVGMEVSFGSASGITECSTATVLPGQCVHVEYKYACHTMTIEEPYWIFWTKKREIRLCEYKGKSFVQRRVTERDC